jgi:predicted metal-binding protein
MDLDQIIKEALDAGFTLAAPLDPKTIRIMPEVRGMCEVNKCDAYGSNWACPPACGTLEECSDMISRYNSGIIVQTTGRLEDDFDSEGMIETAQKHSENIRKFIETYRKKHDVKMLPLGAGGCTICKKCTYPDKPCRFPESMVYPMEGLGILVSDVCTKNNVQYNHGRGTLTYVGCCLFEQ